MQDFAPLSHFSSIKTSRLHFGGFRRNLLAGFLTLLIGSQLQSSGQQIDRPAEQQTAANHEAKSGFVRQTSFWSSSTSRPTPLAAPSVRRLPDGADLKPGGARIRPDASRRPVFHAPNQRCRPSASKTHRLKRTSIRLTCLISQRPLVQCGPGSWRRMAERLLQMTRPKSTCILSTGDRRRTGNQATFEPFPLRNSHLLQVREDIL